MPMVDRKQKVEIENVDLGPLVIRDGSGNITGMVKTDFYGKFTVITGPLGKLTARDTHRHFDI
jgi:hypothetical protein